VRLHGTHPLPDGGSVRLRLPVARDRADLHVLLADLGLCAGDLEIGRALRCVPGRRAAVVASEWDGLEQRLAGFGALELPQGALTLLGRPTVTDLLREALREQAETWRRRVA
jgi:hypothetical protein